MYGLLSCSSDTFANIDVVTYAVFSQNSRDMLYTYIPQWPTDSVYVLTTFSATSNIR